MSSYKPSQPWYLRFAYLLFLIIWFMKRDSQEIYKLGSYLTPWWLALVDYALKLTISKLKFSFEINFPESTMISINILINNYISYDKIYKACDLRLWNILYV